MEPNGDWLTDSILLSTRSLWKEHIQSRLRNGLIKWQNACSKAVLLMHEQQVTQDEKLAKCQYLLDKACKEHVLYSEKAQVKLRKLDQLENEVSSLRSQVACLQSVQEKRENELMDYKEKIKILEESEVLKHDLEERLKLKQDELEGMVAIHSDQKRELQSKLDDCKMQLLMSQEELKKTKLQIEDSEKAAKKYKNMPKDMNEFDDLALEIFRKEVERSNQLEIQLMFMTQHYQQKVEEMETEIQKWQKIDISNRQLITDLKCQLEKCLSDEQTAQKIDLDSRPDTMLFVKAVSSKIKTKWFVFGRCLGIPHGELKSWDMTNRGMQDECFLEVLHYWENNEPQPFTWRTVLKVLESLHEHVIANTLKLELGNLN